MSIWAGTPNLRKAKRAKMPNKPGQIVAMITGATSGIGRAVAKRFAASAAHVVIIGRDPAALEEVAQEIENAGGTSLSLSLDVTNDDDTRNAFDGAINQTGRL